ncbi:resolvase [Enterobacter sp. WCHEn045836]|uniref:VasL domain-containing protein n=1 Tax=Enterobacter sp. WCHEn045836 TaxID=2497434 RepID=UPI000F816BC6|nr:VasL domain-containing protein [Enterobacter sp. WCHEn045836]RTQ03343.1 resolvase [Enterobacter sp. WCHEn045836]
MAYSRKLIEQVQVLWPEQAKALVQQWQQQINISVLPVDKTNGWHDGMTQLQALADKLNALDGQKGKYITVSELKSQVFGMLTSFRQTVPVEEQLRQLRLLPEDSPQRQQQIQQADPITRAVITAINNMLIDLMAAMSHKDWLSRRQRQKQGIERAHTLGKYRGKQADQERHQKVLYYRQVKKLSIQETADATGYSASQVCRIQALHKT